jgi:hypothetical protein
MFLILAQAAPDAAAAAPELTGIAALVVTVVTTLVAMFVTPRLRAKAAAETKKAEAEALNANMSTNEILLRRLKSFLWGQAAAFAEKRFPVLAGQIASGHFKTEGSIKAELKIWHQDLKDSAVKYFGGQGVDLIGAVGDDALDALIERAANAVSPFPGKETAKALLKDRVSDVLVEKGVEWMKSKVEAGEDVSAVAEVANRLDDEEMVTDVDLS